MFPQNQKLNKTIWFQIMIERQYMCGRNVLKYLCTFWLIYVHFRAQLAKFESCILGDWDRSVIHHDTSLIRSRAWIWCFSKIFLDFKDFLLGLTQMWRELFHPFELGGGPSFSHRTFHKFTAFQNRDQTNDSIQLNYSAKGQELDVEKSLKRNQIVFSKTKISGPMTRGEFVNKQIL